MEGLERKKYLLMSVIELRYLSHPAYTVVTKLTELSRLLYESVHFSLNMQTCKAAKHVTGLNWRKR